MKTLFLAIALSCSAGIALAQVTVSAPWVRATVPTGKVTGAFMQLRSAGDARLVEARSSVAGMVEIHRMEMDGQTMRMHAVDGVDLAAGQTVNLASGGYHIMLMDLKRQLKEGEMVPLTLVVEHKNKKRETIELNVPVKPLTYVAQVAH
jgi:periplasmic copper chaperone A